MFVIKTPILAFLLSISFINAQAMKFDRFISAFGVPYYKMLMSLGACKEKVIFDEQKVWANAHDWCTFGSRMARVIDKHGSFILVITTPPVLENTFENFCKNVIDISRRVVGTLGFRGSQAYYTVSRVEINVVINNTDCFALSEKGVGYSDFSATVFVPTSVAIMFYRLTMYTCDMRGDNGEPAKDME